MNEDYDLRDFDGRFRADQGVQARFYTLPMQDHAATAEHGRPMFKDTEFVEILAAGNANNIVKRAGPTVKIQQLTGEVDRQTGQLTRSRTESRSGVIATDLGSSFIHKGKLWFLFGDTWGRPGDRDSIASANITSPSTLEIKIGRAHV